MLLKMLSRIALENKNELDKYLLTGIHVYDDSLIGGNLIDVAQSYLSICLSSKIVNLRGHFYGVF